jgi:hypothetical protein
LVRHKNYRLSLRSSCGLAYLSHHFERVENHKNSAIGSALNAAIQFTLKNSIRISSRMDANIGLGVTIFLTDRLIHRTSASITLPSAAG